MPGMATWTSRRICWRRCATGPIEVTVICHPPLSLSGELNRKALARHAEEQVRKGVALALHDPGKIG